eukprot:2059190-Amphidinium_carterae.1
MDTPGRGALFAVLVLLLLLVGWQGTFWLRVAEATLAALAAPAFGTLCVPDSHMSNPALPRYVSTNALAQAHMSGIQRLTKSTQQGQQPKTASKNCSIDLQTACNFLARGRDIHPPRSGFTSTTGHDLHIPSWKMTTKCYKYCGFGKYEKTSKKYHF